MKKNSRKGCALPSNVKETLYRRLQRITDDAATVLSENDFERLPEIIEAQQAVMVALREEGDCMDTDLVPLITQIRNDVQAVEKKIIEKNAEIRTALRIVANKRKLSKAYGV
jgi:hypothetical protein